MVFYLGVGVLYGFEVVGDEIGVVYGEFLVMLFGLDRLVVNFGEYYS